VVLPKLTKLELKVMDVLWTQGVSSVRAILDRFPAKNRPAYTTIQTVVFRLETKGVVRRVSKVGKAIVFEAVVSRRNAQRRLIDDLLSLFGGRPQTVMAHLIESGRLTLADVRDAERTLKELARKDKSK
jgi:BlaI family penicillinase repressor